MGVRLSALHGLKAILGLWDLDAEQCLAPALGWLLPALYGLFEELEEMDSRQEVCLCVCLCVFDGLRCFERGEQQV